MPPDDHAAAAAVAAVFVGAVGSATTTTARTGVVARMGAINVLHSAMPHAIPNAIAYASRTGFGGRCVLAMFVAYTTTTTTTTTITTTTTSGDESSDGRIPSQSTTHSVHAAGAASANGDRHRAGHIHGRS